MAQRSIVDPAVHHLLHDWGEALGEHRRARGLSEAELARIVGLGPQLTAADVAAAERGQSTVGVLLELSEALDLGVRVELVPAEELRAAWVDETQARELRRRAARAAGGG